MTDDELDRKERRLRSHERFATAEPKCFHCGEDDIRCLESNHVEGQRHERGKRPGAMQMPECRNCHHKISDDQYGHPPANVRADPTIDAIGRFILNLADLLKLLVERLALYGRFLIERAAMLGEAR